MGKFAIICPECNQYVTAYNGIRGLIHNKITCNCGNVINVRAERMTSAKCPSCGNVVVYDQGKSVPSCPVCKEKILPSKGSRVISFKCPECGVGLTASEGTREYTCPICDNHIDVQREIAKESYSRKGLISNIKYEGDSNTLIWKHPIEDFNTGSQLTVHESQEAVFFRDGQALDLFGPGRHTLETQNLPLINKYYPFPTGDAKVTFHSEIYFINKATVMGIKWGTDSKIRVFDPVSGMHVGIGASGEFNLLVIDSRKLLLKAVGTTNGLIVSGDMQGNSFESNGSINASENMQQNAFNSRSGDFKKYFRSVIMLRVKGYLAKVIREQNINILLIDEYLELMSQALQEKINEDLEEYGLTIPEFRVLRFVTPEDDPSDPVHEQYMEMKRLHGQKYIRGQEREVKTTEAETEAMVKVIAAKGEAEAYKLKAGAEAEEMRMKNYTYQQETARLVGTEAMKSAGSGAGSGIGEIAKIGVSLGAIGGMVGMTKEAMQPLTEGSTQIGQMVNQGINQGNGQNDTWDCACGAKGQAGNFCSVCGKARPKPVEAWDCICGAKGQTGNFCSACGKARPKPVKAWDCSCGARGQTGNFCSACGKARPEPVVTWDCSCGMKGQTGRFCSGCGKERGQE